MREDQFDPVSILPGWAREFTAGNNGVPFTGIERMKLAIELSGMNISHGTGGPFGAAVFDRSDGRLVSVGVNLVVRSNCSHAHAEMAALAIAQHTLSTYSLFSPDGPGYELATSCEPCAMCFGAIIWSGVNRVVCGASTDDACCAGFDEGPKPVLWVQELEKRGIEVETGVLRNEAKAVLESYIRNGGIVYNARRKDLLP
ncbi:MAG: nucleoside deaminase [Chlorobiaceae bacterium]|nr:nucleoside deaminase [Chlorobiaceae bacterium]